MGHWAFGPRPRPLALGMTHELDLLAGLVESSGDLTQMDCSMDILIKIKL